METSKHVEDVYSSLTSLLERIDVASSSYKLSTVAAKCDSSLLEDFLTDKPVASEAFPLQTQFYMAVFWGLSDIVRNLIVLDTIDINYQNQKTLWTALHAACFQEHEEIVELLLGSGANYDLPDSEGRTAVDIASASNSVWSQFRELNCTRTSDEDLTAKKLLRDINDITQEMVIQPKKPSFTATETGFRKQNSSTQMKNALGMGEETAPKSRTPSRQLNSSSGMSSILNWSG